LKVRIDIKVCIFHNHIRQWIVLYISLCSVYNISNSGSTKNPSTKNPSTKNPSTNCAFYFSRKHALQ